MTLASIIDYRVVDFVPPCVPKEAHFLAFRIYSKYWFALCCRFRTFYDCHAHFIMPLHAFFIGNGMLQGVLWITVTLYTQLLLNLFVHGQDDHIMNESLGNFPQLASRSQAVYSKPKLLQSFVCLLPEVLTEDYACPSFYFEQNGRNLHVLSSML